MNGYYWLFGKQKQGVTVRDHGLPAEALAKEVPRDPVRVNARPPIPHISEAPASANGLRSPLVRQTCAVIG
jgi:hypothetical protein